MPVKSYIDPKFYLVHSNLNKVILNMGSYDIPMEAMFEFFVSPDVAARLSMLVSDRGDIYRNYYAVYLSDQRYMADLLTSIKLKLQARTQEAYDIKAALRMQQPQELPTIPDVD